tara:strand:- start:15125 stop:15766 length:642 start_codon:yes stop_codon:yes gene_type:complete
LQHLKKKYQLLFSTILLLVSSAFYAQIHCGLVQLQSSATVAANFTFTDFSSYNSGITLLSVARLRVRVDNKSPVDLDCSWKLRMFIENNSGAGTLADKWEEITLYGNGNALKPSISDLEVRVNNNCGTPLNTGFRSFTDVNDILNIIEEMVPQVIVPAGSCNANGTKNVNGPGNYLTNYNEYSFDVDLRLKPGFKFNPGVYRLNIKFRLEEVN